MTLPFAENVFTWLNLVGNAVLPRDPNDDDDDDEDEEDEHENEDREPAVIREPEGDE